METIERTPLSWGFDTIEAYIFQKYLIENLNPFPEVVVGLLENQHPFH